MKLLVVEDDLTSVSIVNSMLKDTDYEPVFASNGIEAWYILNEEAPPRIVISDWVMPDMDGITLCSKIREKEKNGLNYTYFIMITQKSDKSDFVTGMSCGADDYISKPIDRDEFYQRLRAGRRIIDLTDKLANAKSELEELSRTDELTGIFNRRGIIDLLCGEMFRSLREKVELSVAMIDLDFFKKINDKYGHQVGDEVLFGFTNRTMDYTRRYDLLGRYGGEEFLLILPNTSPETSYNVLSRICNSFRVNQIKTSAGNIPITVSVGLAHYMPQDTIESILQRADEALYSAKSNGRDRIEVY